MTDIAPTQPHESTGDLARHARDAAHLTLLAVESLLTVARAQQTPAIPETFELSAVTPIKRSEAGAPCLSLGVVNPNDFVIRLGLAGGSAHPDARGIPVPPLGALVWPVSVEDFELGADPDDLQADTAIVYVLRFATVQPFHMSGRSDG